MEELTVAIQALTTISNIASSAISGLVGSVNSFIIDVKTGFGLLNSAIGQAAGSANVGAYRALQLASEDAAAAIGREFVPVLQAATPLVRAVGDAFASLGPAARDIFGSLPGLIRENKDTITELKTQLVIFAESVGHLVSTLKALLSSTFTALNTEALTFRDAAEGLGIAISGLVVTFEILAERVKSFSEGNINAFDDMFVSIAERLKLLRSQVDLKGSLGAAARPASYSSFSEIGRQANLAAFGQSNYDPARDTAANTKKLVEYQELVARQTAEMNSKLPDSSLWTALKQALFTPAVAFAAVKRAIS